MSQEKYVAYVSTYTVGQKDNYGIRIYDVDMKNGRMTEKNQVEITNSSYISISHNGKYLYSIWRSSTREASTVCGDVTSLPIMRENSFS